MGERLITKELLEARRGLLAATWTGTLSIATVRTTSLISRKTWPYMKRTGT